MQAKQADLETVMEADGSVVEFSPPDELAAIQAEIAMLMGG